MRCHWRSAELKQWNVLPGPASEQGPVHAIGVWHGVTQLTVAETQKTAADAADANNAADYEL